jgi:hypothetical protein
MVSASHWGVVVRAFLGLTCAGARVRGGHRSGRRVAAHRAVGVSTRDGTSKSEAVPPFSAWRKGPGMSAQCHREPAARPAWRCPWRMSRRLTFPLRAWNAATRRHLPIPAHPISPTHLFRCPALRFEEFVTGNHDNRALRAARGHVEAVRVEQEGHAPWRVLGCAAPAAASAIASAIWPASSNHSTLSLPS